LERSISELDEEIASLSTVKSILTQFVEELRIKTDMVLQLDILNDTAALSIADSISFSKNYINNIKGNVTMEKMENLNKANETLSKLKDSDVRIVYLPPMTVAYVRGVAGTKKGDTIEKFVRETGLLKIKPDARGMVANNFSKEYLKSEHIERLRKKGSEYEVWVSIPDSMEVKAPLIKKTFEGGLYAAHLVRNGIIENFCSLAEWINASEKYEFDDERLLFQELLNYGNYISNCEKNNKIKKDVIQVDLLAPIEKITG